MTAVRAATAVGGMLVAAVATLGAAVPASADTTPTTVWSNVADVPAVAQFQAVGSITVGQGAYSYHWRVDGRVVSPVYYGTCASTQCVIDPNPPNFEPGLRQYLLNTPDRAMKKVYLGLTANPPADGTPGMPATVSATVTVTPMSS